MTEEQIITATRAAERARAVGIVRSVLLPSPYAEPAGDAARLIEGIEGAFPPDDLDDARDEEHAALRQQITALRLEATALIREAESLASQRDAARGSHRLQQGATRRFHASADQAEARLADFRRFLDEDFRQWCSPDGITSTYAGRLIEILDQTGTDHG